jgi:cytochrome c oxidase assembly factor CtaG
MRNILRNTLLAINIISFGLVAIFGFTGIIYELFGPASYDKMLERLNIPWRFEQIWTFSLICLVVLIITYIMRKKLFS